MSDPKLVVYNYLLYESPTLCIYYDTTHNWLYSDWIGEQNVETIKEGCRQLLHFLKAQRCHKILNDNTRVTNIWSDAAEWIAADFLPEACKAGLEYLAWIYSPDQFSRLSTDEVLSRHEVSTVSIPFCSYAEAANWLASV